MNKEKTLALALMNLHNCSEISTGLLSLSKNQFLIRLSSWKVSTLFAGMLRCVIQIHFCWLGTLSLLQYSRISHFPRGLFGSTTQKWQGESQNEICLITLRKVSKVVCNIHSFHPPLRVLSSHCLTKWSIHVLYTVSMLEKGHCIPKANETKVCHYLWCLY